MEESTPVPWRAWAFGGAATSLLAYLVEYYPGHMDTQLRVNGPLYGLAWLGLGELLWRFSAWARGEAPSLGLRSAGMWLISAAAVASPAIAIARGGDRGFLADDLLSAKLANLPNGVAAADLMTWATREGPSWALAATLLPVVLLLPAAWLLLSNRTSVARRRALAVTLSPALVALAFAVFRLRWWTSFDGVLLALLATAAVAKVPGPRTICWLSGAILTAALALGVAQLAPGAGIGASRVIRLTRSEVEGLYERGLSHWIADHAGPEGATVLAPPLRTSSLCYYGGLRGLGTQNWENRDGMLATFHIFASMRPDESQAVIRQRGVTDIVLLPWDTDLEDYARSSLKYLQASFIYSLRNPPGGGFSWLRPVPYEVPPVSGLEGLPVLVLSVTDETDPATVQGRLVEYLTEMHETEQAAAAGAALLRYPADLGALSARAELAKARRDNDEFARVFKSVVSTLSRGSDRRLPWDRRVSLAVVLALGGRYDLSRAQVRRCIDEIDDERIRSLTTESLYHLLLLGRRFGTEIPDPGLHALALGLLPEKLRERF